MTGAGVDSASNGAGRSLVRRRADHEHSSEGRVLLCTLVVVSARVTKQRKSEAFRGLMNDLQCIIGADTGGEGELQVSSDRSSRIGGVNR